MQSLSTVDYPAKCGLANGSAFCLGALPIHCAECLRVPHHRRAPATYDYAAFLPEAGYRSGHHTDSQDFLELTVANPLC